MEKTKQIEFLLSGILLILILGVILTSIYLEPPAGDFNVKTKNFLIYEKNSEKIIQNGVYYSKENVYIIYSDENAYYEKISKTNFLNARNKVILENEVYIENNFRDSNVMVNIN